MPLSQFKCQRMKLARQPRLNLKKYSQPKPRASAEQEPPKDSINDILVKRTMNFDGKNNVILISCPTLPTNLIFDSDQRCEKQTGPL